MLPFVIPSPGIRRLASASAPARLAAALRVNALACIWSARHGWIGASFSVAEVLATLYFRLGERNIVLSKGHAAAMQYAALHGLGILPEDALLTYKDGPAGLQAHTDRCTPGILLDTGSLGQALSRTTGLAWARPDDRFWVILGDGELQEGQVWEALQTVHHLALPNLRILLDRNGFQTEQRVECIKPVPDLEAVLGGLGFEVRRVDGHDPAALEAVLAAPADGPVFVIADTVKASGTSLLAPEGDRQPWHGRIPDAALYVRIVADLVARVGDASIEAAFLAWRAASPEVPAVAASPSVPSTADGLARRLEVLLDRRPDLVVLSADLARACRLDAIANPAGRFSARGQFLEMGIAEQDMVSFAGGLALGGRLPIVNTYAAFLKRAIEQVQTNLGEGRKVLYAAHYAGLGYHTDGKSHQSQNDLGLWCRLPGLRVVEPVTDLHAAALLDWAVDEAPGSVLIRLHRTGRALPLTPDPADPTRPLAWRPDAPSLLVCAGPVATRLAWDLLQTPTHAGWGLVAQVAFGVEGCVDTAPLAGILAGATQVWTLEEDVSPGTLSALVDRTLVDLGRCPDRRRLAITRPGWSFRSLEGSLAWHGFSAASPRWVPPTSG